MISRYAWHFIMFHIQWAYLSIGYSFVVYLRPISLLKLPTVHTQHLHLFDMLAGRHDRFPINCHFNCVVSPF